MFALPFADTSSASYLWRHLFIYFSEIFFFFGFYLKIYNTNLLMVEPFICFLSSFPFALYKLCASPKQEEFQYDRKKNKNKLRPHFIPKLKERN